MWTKFRDLLLNVTHNWIILSNMDNYIGAYTGLFISPWNISKIHNKYIIQRIMVVLTLTQTETLKVFFFYTFHRCSMCPPLVIRQTSIRKSIPFHTHVSISRSTRATVVVFPSGKSGQLCAGGYLQKTSTISLSIDVRITMIRCVVHLLRIF